MLTERANVICILKILQEYSDEQHILSTKEIVRKLEVKYGMRIDRRSLYKAVALLQELDYDISSYDDNKRGYYLRVRDFEPSQIALLTDAVYSFPFISDKQSRELINTLQCTQSIHQRRHYKHLHVQRTGGKTKNLEVFLNIEKLDEAIEQRCKVSFVYLKYDLSKRLVPRRVERYIVSPYHMVFCNEHYYLACVMMGEESASLYRIDRMQDIEVCGGEADKRHPDFEKEVSGAVYAFMGALEQITLLCENHVLDDIIDKFGSDIRVREADEEHLKVTVTASVEGMKYWALQYLSCVEILEPEDLRTKVIERLRNNPYMGAGS